MMTMYSSDAAFMSIIDELVAENIWRITNDKIDTSYSIMIIR